MIPVFRIFTAFCFAVVALASEAVQAQPGRGPGGIGGPGGVDVALVKKFDQDNDGRLSKSERALARKEIVRKPGPKVSPEDVTNYSSEGLFDSSVLRTIFLTFDASDWEKELQDFKPTDVEVPAMMMVDGKEYPNVGVSFRGASSFFMVSEGSKRSFNISMDYMDDKQKLLGYKSK